MRPSNTPWRAYACLAASMALVGTYVALSRSLTQTLPVFLLAWLRFAIGAIAMVGWLRPTGVKISGRTHAWLFVESLFGNFLFSICMLAGVALTSATAAAVVMSAIPACVAVMSLLLLGERLSPRTLGAVVLAVLGVGIYALSKSELTNANPCWLGANLCTNEHTTGAGWGWWLLMGAVVCESTYAVVGKKLTTRLSAQHISALINLWGLVLMTPLGLYQAQAFDFSTVSIDQWGLLVFYALAASMGSVWLWMLGLQRVPASQAGIFTMVLPMTSALVGMLWLGERLSGLQWLGLAVALFGLILATYPASAGRQSSDW